MICSSVFLLSLRILRCSALEVLYNIKSPNCGARDVINSVDILDHVIDLGQYGMNASIMTSFQFEVKACGQVSVYATENFIVPLSKDIYSVYIGGGDNIWNRIRGRRYGDNYEVSTSFKRYLSCNEFASLWFSWLNGEIKAGSGYDVGDLTFTSYSDLNPFKVNGLAISTCWGATGEWRLNVNVQYQSTGFFSRCTEQDTKADVLSLDMYSVTSSMCAAECSAINECYGFNYHRYARKCELLYTGGGPLDSIRFVPETGWNFYAKCYRGKEVCVGCFFVE